MQKTFKSALLLGQLKPVFNTFALMALLQSTLPLRLGQGLLLEALIPVEAPDKAPEPVIRLV